MLILLSCHTLLISLNKTCQTDSQEITIDITVGLTNMLATNSNKQCQQTMPNKIAWLDQLSKFRG